MIISQKKTAEEIHHYSRCTEPKYYLLIFSGTLILHAKKSQWWMQGFASNAWQVRQVEKPRSRAEQFSNFWTFAAFLSAIRELDKEEKRRASMLYLGCKYLGLDCSKLTCTWGSTYNFIAVSGGLLNWFTIFVVLNRKWIDLSRFSKWRST